MGTWGSGVVGGEEVGGEAADFGDFPHLRCLLGFLPALKATDFAGFPFLRCLFALLRGGEAANFSHFPHLRCLLALLRGEKATYFSAFPHLRCLDAHAPENEFFRQTHCNPAPGMVQYRVSSYVSRHACMAGEHRLRPAQT